MYKSLISIFSPEKIYVSELAHILLNSDLTPQIYLNRFPPDEDVDQGEDSKRPVIKLFHDRYLLKFENINHKTFYTVNWAQAINKLTLRI